MVSLLPRVQLFEWNDLPWVPAAVRDTVVESLSRTLQWGKMLDGMVAPFEQFLDEAGTREVLDLGAGGGGPALILARAITRAGRTPPRFILTDLHPRVEAWCQAKAEQPGVIDYVPSSVDATAIPRSLAHGRVRTVINVLHHFPPGLATAIFADAVRSSRGIFVAEPFARNPLAFASFIPVGLPALVLNPLLSKKDRMTKALLTWATPAAFAIGLWDGIVSTLREYTTDELYAMVKPFGTPFRWGHGTYEFWPLGRYRYFWGVPRDRDTLAI